MKLTCDLCGGVLQMNVGGQDATCVCCGITYSIERLREKLGMQTHAEKKPGEKVVQNPPKPIPEDDIVYDVIEWKKVETPAAPKTPFFVPQQFVLQLYGGGIGDFSGFVRQGAVGLGDKVYVDHDYRHPYTVYCLCDNTDITCVKAGAYADIFLTNCPNRILKKAQIVTGDPNPVANAYNYPGTVGDYFSNLLCREFSQHEIRENVPKGGLNIPVSYLFHRGGKPVLAVFLVNSNDSKARYQVEKAARIFALEGVSCVHFYENYRNDAPYVINRIQGALG